MLDAILQAAKPALTVAFSILASPVSWLEVIAFWLSIWMVLANFRVNPVAWPLAIVSSLLYGLLFAESKLYGEASLQIVFIVVAFWGWWQWQRGSAEDGGRLQVHRLAPKQRWQLLAATLAGWPLLGLLLARTTDSDVPYLDALPTVGSLAGQFLLGRKLVENWPVWLAVNVFSVGLFAIKALWLTVALYAIFAMLSLVGWREWQKMARG